MVSRLDKLQGRDIYENTALAKINELCDVVNDITDWIKRTDETIVKYGIKPISEKIAQGFKNLQDPYSEQRKWIGKICKFWNWDTGLAHYSKLITIKDINDGEMSNCPFRADDGGWYMYCEPVKPDDDIIYKGE